MPKQTEYITFAEILRDRRISLGLTQRELGEAIGCGQSQISEYETGTVQPTLPLFIVWAYALNFNITLENVK